MIGINDVVEKLGDDVFIRGIDLSQPFKPMTDNELAIEELQGMAGGLIAIIAANKINDRKGSNRGLKLDHYGTGRRNSSGFVRIPD